MGNAEIAYLLRILFEQKITSFYVESYKGKLGKVQIEVLDYLYEHNFVKGHEIACALNISKQHVSKIILKFQEIGFVEAISSVGDKREKLYGLTQDGKAYVKKHINESNIHFENLVAKLSKKEQLEMLEAMKTMTKILEKL